MTRPALPSDIAPLTALLRHAFGGEAEARLLDALRAEGWLVAEFVATEGDRLAGCVALSRLERDPDGAPLVALAPLAVAEPCRRRGIGGELVQVAIEAARQAGMGGVVVLGDPAFYERFGFRVEPRLRCLWTGPHLLYLEVRQGAIEGPVEIGYAPAFETV